MMKPFCLSLTAAPLLLLLSSLSCVSLTTTTEAYSPDCTAFNKLKSKQPKSFHGISADAISLTCTEADSNPRGYYTSTLAPCTFRFHRIPHPSPKRDQDSSLHLSTLCGNDKNPDRVIDTLKEYVTDWPDECVGDFVRCYTVGKDDDIFLPFVCEKKWNFPQNTTHFSVNCRHDKHKQQAAFNETRDRADRYRNAKTPYEKQMEQQRREVEKLIVIVIVSLVAICMCCMVTTYVLCFKPYMETWRDMNRRGKFVQLSQEDRSDADDGDTTEDEGNKDGVMLESAISA